MPEGIRTGVADPNVCVSSEAPLETKRLWSLHGDPYSDRYSDPSINTIAALVEYAAATYGPRTAFVYPLSDDVGSSYGSVSWEDFHRVTDAVAGVYAEQLVEELGDANERGVQPTVGVLGKGTGIEFYMTVVAMQKLSVRVLLLNPSFSSEVMQSLLDRCKAVALVQDDEYSAAPLSVPHKIVMVEDPFLLPMSSISTIVRFEDNLDPWSRHSIIIHSSGSTGMPKPIVHTNRSLLLIARMYRLFPTYHIQNWYLLFILQGITAMIILPSGLPYGLPTIFPPRESPPSPETILRTMETVAGMGYPPDCLHTNPQLIEVIFNHINATTKDFSPLRDLKVLQPGGALLSEHVSGNLAEEGVNVKQTYGSSELGPLMRTYPHDLSNRRVDSMRLVPLPGMGTHVRMEPVDSGLHELVVHQGFPVAAELWGSGLGAQVAEGGTFHTNDLFVPDELSGEGSWILRGRRDDMLVLAGGGVNVAAVEVEDMVLREAEGLVRAAMLVGHGRLRAGLLVELLEVAEKEGAEERVWSVVEKVNRGLRDKARIAGEMVVVLDDERRLPVGMKGHVKRKVALKLYRKEIDQLYMEEENRNRVK
ncbi:MAG: hypothetical protein Q9208_005336 [Pyrenodesmia sp. 3 TL-2023]